MMKQMHRGVSAFLTLALLFSLIAPAFAAQDDAVHIQTAADLDDLAVSCALDQWSQGKTVLLDADLDLTGRSFSPIPTFGGTFDGQGHTIAGLSITGSGNVRGLFRYIQPSGVVQNLTVNGNILPTDLQDDLGLIAGSNRGKIIKCRTAGTVQGKNRIGGIAGVNEADGAIINCAFSGKLTGEHFAGGIAGENHGTLTQCENSGSINTSDLADVLEVEDPDLQDLNSATHLPQYTDIGGVAGISNGTIQSCRNTGAVGYAHIGYNVGGVAGRSGGYLDGCTNSGAVLGRKDVGGIVGQLAPEVIRNFSEDFLEQLLDESDVLLGLMDQMLNHAGSTADNVSDQMRALSNKAKNAKDIAGKLTDAMVDWGNGTIDQVNDLSARLSWTLDQTAPILDNTVSVMADMEKAANRLDDAMRKIEDAADQMRPASDDAVDAIEQAKDAMDELRQGINALQTAMTRFESVANEIRQALEDLRASLGDPAAAADAAARVLRAMEQLETAAQSIRTACRRIADAFSLLDGVSDATLDAMRISMDAMDTLREAADLLESAGDTLDTVLSGLTDITAALRDMVQELSGEAPISLPSIGSDITAQGDALDAALDKLLAEGDTLNTLLDTASDTLVADMKAISNQFRVILNLIRTEKTKQAADQNESVESQIRDWFEDVSEQGSFRNQHDGRVSASRNEGAVAGDVNVGGITGSISIEYDFDPEDDLKRVGDYSLEYTYKAKSVLFSCVNTADVTAKQDYAGGVVGRMDMGLLADCEGYGAVCSTDGGYVGGLAGACYATVQDSWAKCSLSGADYIGGIAGLGSTLKNCHTLVRIEQGAAYQGAIAGGLDETDESAAVAGNTFAGELAGAIDGISYAGKAEPVSFDSLCTTDGVPDAFAQLALTFVVDGETIAVTPFQYGGAVESLPEIPPKKGYYAAWPAIDYTHLTSDYTLEAVYTPYRSALSEGGDFPEILVDGTFSGNATVSHTTAPVSWTDARGTAHESTAYTVTVDDPDFTDISYTVHYKLPDPGKRYDLWVQTVDGWAPHDFTVDGSYLLLPCAQSPVTFCVTERGANYLLIAGVLLAVLLLAALLIWRKRRKKQPPTDAQGAPIDAQDASTDETNLDNT